MKVVEMLGGLGSQMFKYAFYEHLKEQTSDKVYIDTSSYYFKQVWNGYELKEIFGIDAPDIWSDDFGSLTDRWPYHITSYRKYAYRCIKKQSSARVVTYFSEGKPSRDNISRFLLSDNTLYKLAIEIYKCLINVKKMFKKTSTEEKEQTLPAYFKQESHHQGGATYPDDYAIISGAVLYDEADLQDDRYFPHRDRLMEVFKFPEWEEEDEKNRLMSENMLKEDSVAMHIRRGDHLYDNEELFTSYFSKSVEYIINNTNTKPHFYIFSDELEWCKENCDVIGFKNYISKDESDYNITFVDNNDGSRSYKDMQLMTYCKHNIIPSSTFSWWGAYLSKHDPKEKITIAPKGYWPTVGVHL